MSQYGYIRVSTREQNEDRQRIAMEEYGISEGNIILDKQSGKDFERPGFLRLMKKIKPHDVIVIKSIDRLGRNYEDILEQWRYITKIKKAYIVVLDMPLLNTAQDKDLTGSVISDIVLQLLSYVAETERNFIHQRQAEGISAAKERGVRFGRPAMIPPPEYELIKTKWEKGEISARKAAECLKIDHHTFLKWVNIKNK